jgi:hypothetical protein
MTTLLWYVEPGAMPKLVYHDSDGIDQVINLGAEPILVGRASECQIQTQDAMVSRRHARIVWDGNYWVEDLGSSNGVYVGSEKVRERAPFRPGDTVTCGSLVMRMLPDATPRASSAAAALAVTQPPPSREPARASDLHDRRRRPTDPPPPEPQAPRGPELHPEISEAVARLGVMVAAMRVSLRTANGEATLLKQPEESADIVRQSLHEAIERVEEVRQQLRNLSKLLGN